MTQPSDRELRWEGVRGPMKIQVRVGPSRIAGQGLFAAQDITKGTRITQYIGRVNRNGIQLSSNICCSICLRNT